MAPYGRFSHPVRLGSAPCHLGVPFHRGMPRAPSHCSALCSSESLRTVFTQMAPCRRFAPPLRLVSAPFYFYFVCVESIRSVPRSYHSALYSPKRPCAAPPLRFHTATCPFHLPLLRFHSFSGLLRSVVRPLPCASVLGVLLSSKCPPVSPPCPLRSIYIPLRFFSSRMIHFSDCIL